MIHERRGTGWRSTGRRAGDQQTVQELKESEDRYRILVDMLPQIVWISRPDGQVEFFSSRWYEYTGGTPGDSEGEGWRRYLHPDDREPSTQAWMHAVRTGQRFVNEARIRDREGKYRWFLEQASPQRDEEGAIIRWVGTLTEVEEQKRLSEERARLLEVEKRARQEAEQRVRDEQAMREAVAAVGARFTTDEITQQIADSAVSATKSVGALMAVVRPEEDRVEIVATSGESPPAPDSYRYQGSFSQQVIEHRLGPLLERLGDYRGGLWPDGVAPGYREWSLLVVTLRMGDKSFGALLLFRKPDQEAYSSDEIERALTFGDLTGLAFEKIHLLEQEERRREELERVTQSRSRLMRGFGHDVKNPLGAADGYAQLLEDGLQGPLTDEQRDSVQGIRRSIHTSLQLIGDLMELARAETGELEIEQVPADLARIVRESAEDFRAQATAKGLELEVRAEGEIAAETDPLRVKQVLGNLLSNAVKYTEKGSIAVDICADPTSPPPREGRWLTVEVTDTGPGIPADKQATIFQEFTRLDPHAPHGAGVGLAISRRIAHLLDGEITVDSKEGEGSTFTLWLPAR